MKRIKLTKRLFKGEMVLSPSWIGGAPWCTLRERTDAGHKSREMLETLFDLHRVVEQTDAVIEALPTPMEEWIVYERSPVLLDYGHEGIGRLFVAENGDVACIKEDYVQALDLWSLHGERAALCAVRYCRHVLVQREEQDGKERTVLLVMPMEITRKQSESLIASSSVFTRTE